MRTWGGATTTPRDLSTPSLNIGAGSFSRDRRNIAQYFSGARGRSRNGCCLWRSRTTMWPTMSLCRARESCRRFFACTIRSYSRHCAHSHSPSWNTTARTAYFLVARDLLPTLTTLSLRMARAQKWAWSSPRSRSWGHWHVHVDRDDDSAKFWLPRWRWRVTLASRRLSCDVSRGSSLSMNQGYSAPRRVGSARLRADWSDSWRLTQPGGGKPWRLDREAE